MDEELANIAYVAQPGSERKAVFCVPENERRARQVQAEAAVVEAMKNVDPEALGKAADEAQAAGLSACVVLRARRQVRCLKAKEALAVAMVGNDANALEDACSSAESAGVFAPDVSRAKRRVQRLRAAMELACAMRTVDPEHIEKVAGEAEARGVNTTAPSRSADIVGLDTGAVAEAKREVSRLRAELRTTRALLGDDPTELERAANDALSIGTFSWAKEGMTSIAQEARDKARMLCAAAATVHPKDVSDARWQADWLRSKGRFDSQQSFPAQKSQSIPRARLSFLCARARPTAHTASALSSMRGHVHGETSTAGLPSGLPPMCPLALRRGHQQ